MKQPKDRRKKIILINREFQLRYTRAALAVGLISTVLTSVLILFPLYTFEILRIPRFLPTPILVAMVFAAIVNIGFIAFMGVILTHKIAGPMYSLVKHVRLIGMGHWKTSIHVRDDDELKFVVRNFNEMIDGLLQMNAKDLELVRGILEKVELSNSDQHNDIKRLVCDLQERLENRQKAVS
jgi:methyl-accepting chemotaxis protein